MSSRGDSGGVGPTSVFLVNEARSISFRQHQWMHSRLSSARCFLPSSNLAGMFRFGHCRYLPVIACSLPAKSAIVPSADAEQAPTPRCASEVIDRPCQARPVKSRTPSASAGRMTPCSVWSRPRCDHPASGPPEMSSAMSARRDEGQQAAAVRIPGQSRRRRRSVARRDRRRRACPSNSAVFNVDGAVAALEPPVQSGRDARDHTSPNVAGLAPRGRGARRRGQRHRGRAASGRTRVRAVHRQLRDGVHTLIVTASAVGLLLRQHLDVINLASCAAVVVWAWP
jgi:hypothetical protein